MKIEKFTFSSPNSQVLIGSTNQSTSARPAPVWTARSGTPSACRSGTSPRITSETPRPSVTASFAPTPDTASAAPKSTPSAPNTRRRRRRFCSGGSGRLRIAVTMFMRLTRQAEKATTTSVSSTPIA